MNKNTNDQAILFLSDKSSEYIVNNYNLLKNAAPENSKVYFMYHKKNTNLPAIIQNLEHFVFTNKILEELCYSPIDRCLVPGSNHYPMLKFYLQNPQYDYYWNIEDDVYFHGDWHYLFESFCNSSADFISSHIETYNEAPHWYWWNTLVADGEEISVESRVRSFNPIYRLSNKALELINKSLLNGWSGHHEVLIPTLLYKNGYEIIDMGGTGSFVPNGSENRFYTNESMSDLPIELGNAKNRIYHPIKEIRKIDFSTLKKSCVVTVAGRNSLHSGWIKTTPNFDLHLIVCDNSYNEFRNDTSFITCKRGSKFKLVYDYLMKNTVYLEKYEYFFIPNDDILVDTESINRLFCYMKDYDLSIAQPALIDSYYTYEHTLKRKSTLLRYSDFVEMMMPCFSQDALKKVIFTFNESNSDWGVEYRWSELIGFSGTEMAIIDDVEAVNLRLPQLFNNPNIKGLSKLVERYKLSREINEYSSIPSDDYKLNGNRQWEPIVTNNSIYCTLERQLEIITDTLLRNIDSIEDLGLFGGKTGMSLFFLNYYKLSGKRKLLDSALAIIESVSSNLGFLKDNTDFSNGLSGIAWYIESLAQNGYIENNTDEVLEEICLVLNELNFSTLSKMGISKSLIGYGLYFQARMSNPNFSPEKQLNSKEININNIIVCSLDDYLDRFRCENCISIQDEHEISDIILFLYKALKINTDNKILIQILSGYVAIFYSYLAKKETIIANTKIETITMLNCELKNAYALFKASNVLRDREKENFSIKMALETISQTSIENIDVGVLYTTMRVAHLYNHFYQLTSIETFKTASLYWMNLTFSQKKIQSEVNLNLVGGLTGVGLILISAIADFKPDWDNCLLI